MAFLWENYSIENQYKLSTKNFCPYVEIFESINNISEVNILYRFQSIYDELNYDLKKEYVKFDDKDYNVLFHILANVDFYSGISNKDIRLMKIYDDICSGMYGESVRKIREMSFEHKYKILSYMDIRKQSNNRKNVFFDFLTEIFKVNLMYSEYEDTYLIEISCREDFTWEGKVPYTAGELFDIAKRILCDYWINVEVCWNKRIGLICDGIEFDKTIFI